MEPLSTMALENSPFAEGIAIRVDTLPPPPLWPKMVTFAGSPPKLAMLSRTHSSALTMSIIPRLPLCAYLAPKAERSRKPRTLSRWFRETTTTPWSRARFVPS